MAVALNALGGLFGLVSFVCLIVITVHAFKKHGALQGLLTFFLCPFTLYYALKKYDGSRKALVVGGWIGGAVLAGVLGAISPTATLNEGVGEGEVEDALEEGWEDEEF
jgi:hypothetical protein